MNNFVYAPRSLWLPEKKKLVKLIGCVQDEIHDRFTFSYNFIGSAERGLITYEPDGNKGFDFDVNIHPNDPDENYGPDELRHIFKQGLDEYSQYFEYDYAEDSKRVLTIKVKDSENSRILHSCDFAIVYDCNDGRQQFVYFNKKQGTYEWQYQPKGFYHLKERTEWIKQNGFWPEVRDLYLYKKNMNENPSKKSRSIFAETINEVYNGHKNLF